MWSANGVHINSWRSSAIQMTNGYIKRGKPGSKPKVASSKKLSYLFRVKTNNTSNISIVINISIFTKEIKNSILI
jgi:hypothetical protein